MTQIMKTDGTKFNAFNRVDRTYSVISGHNLDASIFVPKKLESDVPRPILVHFHGGGLILGHRLYEPWYGDWLLQIALSRGAVIVAPDFRLLPEAGPLDIFEDINQFWRWMYEDLPGDALSWTDLPPLKLDMDRIALHGESSGGWLAVHSCLGLPEDRIKLLITSSASIDHTVPYLTVPAPKSILGRPPIQARQAERTIQRYVRGILPGAIRTATDPLDLWDVFVCMIQQGYYSRILNGPGLGNLDTLKTLPGAEGFCPAWIIHGQDDTVAPPECSANFVQQMRKLKPEVPVRFTLCPGDHGFDKDCTTEDGWVKDGIAFIENYWP